MNSQATTAVASACLALFACGVGILLGRWTVEQPSAPQFPAPDLSAEVADLRRSIEEDLRSLHQQIQTASLDPDRREPVGDNKADLDGLRRMVEQLNRNLDQGTSAVPPAPGLKPQVIDDWKGPGFPSIEILWGRMGGVPDYATSAAYVALMKEFTKAHLLWTREDLFARYGRPSDVEMGTGRVCFAYRSPILPDWILRFESAEGLITQVTFVSPRPLPPPRR